MPRPASALLGVIVCAIVEWAAGPAGLARASEVISAIPGRAQAPFTPATVVETIEAGTRGPAPAPHHGRAEGCRGGRCAHGHCGHAGCRHGSCGVPGCPAHCPVRPASFGFYGTQWRTWPGQQVAQAAHVEPAAPVMPPKSEVPSADEESPVPGFDMPAPEPDGTQTEPADELPTEPALPEPAPTAVPPAEQRAPGEPAPLPTPEARPQTEKPAVPADDNLFDEAALRRRSQERLAVLRQAAAHQERLRHDALRQLAPRVSRPRLAAGVPSQAPLSTAATRPSDHVVGAALLPVPAETRGGPLQQAVHAEPDPADASAEPPAVNPLR